MKSARAGEIATKDNRRQGGTFSEPSKGSRRITQYDLFFGRFFLPILIRPRNLLLVRSDWNARILECIGGFLTPVPI